MTTKLFLFFRKKFCFGQWGRNLKLMDASEPNVMNYIQDILKHISNFDIRIKILLNGNTKYSSIKFHFLNLMHHSSIKLLNNDTKSIPSIQQTNETLVKVFHWRHIHLANQIWNLNNFRKLKGACECYQLQFNDFFCRFMSVFHPI